MVFTILGSDPLQEIFAVDAVRSAARTDGHWHIDQMPPIDCMLLFAGEMGGSGMQLIQGIQICNWGEVVSIDDIYTEVTYSFIADHMTPFISSDYIGSVGSSSNKIFRAIDSIIGSINDHAKTPDDAIERALAGYDKEIRDTYGSHIRNMLFSVFQRYIRARRGDPASEAFINSPGNVSTLSFGPEVPESLKNNL